MKRLLYLFILVLFFGCVSLDREPLVEERILFIGNDLDVRKLELVILERDVMIEDLELRLELARGQIRDLRGCNWYIVKRGDCLWSIAVELYGNGLRWRGVYRDNLDIIDDSDLIYVGQRFRVMRDNMGMIGGRI